ncbi:hypothetical protein [Aneurinibacillus terranovensis]|uniref:hypothetical protein n=1 Tax=Aneurinibacillus terranovensis TaxID=278991 RepID=UPI0012DC35F4|nr:hypothetical protein [Aneurinibacillus terranovensis]
MGGITPRPPFHYQDYHPLYPYPYHYHYHYHYHHHHYAVHPYLYQPAHPMPHMYQPYVYDKDLQSQYDFYRNSEDMMKLKFDEKGDPVFTGTFGYEEDISTKKWSGVQVWECPY